MTKTNLTFAMLTLLLISVASGGFLTAVGVVVLALWYISKLIEKPEPVDPRIANNPIYTAAYGKVKK